jgi:hypothetical protein
MALKALIKDVFAGWRGDPNIAIGGNVYALTILLRIRTGFAEDVRQKTRALPRDPSPFANLARTHFARLVVLDRLQFEGPARQAPDVRGQFLLFTAVIDGKECRDYLGQLCVEGGEDLWAIWRLCEGAPAGADGPAFVRWMLRHQLTTRAFFRDYDGTAAQVNAALRLRDEVRAFALANQYATPPDLHARFREAFPR